MPIYEYACNGCGCDVELLVASSSVKPACPECGSKKLAKKFSTFAAHQSSPASPCGTKRDCANAARCPAAGRCGL
ncbi:MAG: zinc ribbon domain-containing protein [Phycisphaerae bacterium]|nr:zinc ribbon domain-containing protein [Phycisphaerae bacterium]